MRLTGAVSGPFRLRGAALVAKMHSEAPGQLTVVSAGETVSVMKLSISADIELDGPSNASYVTWLDVRIGDSNRADQTFGVARVAIVHVGEIADALGDLYPALHGTKLESLASAYFAEGWYKDDFADGAGIDLLYVESVEIDAAHQHKNIELAMVRRLCDSIGSGCQLAVMPYRDAITAGHWGQLGFALTTPGRTAGLMHMKLGYRHAQVVDSTGSGEFEVLPTVVLHDRHLDN